MAIDLNTVLDDGDGHPLPDKDEKTPDEQEDQVHLLPDKDEKTPDEQEDQVHLLQEDEIQAGLQEAQPHHLQEGEQVVVHQIELDVDASRLEQ